MPRVFEDKVAGACSGKRSLQCAVLRVISYVPFSKTVGLTYASGALTATWAKLRGLRNQGINQRKDKQTSGSHLDEPGRHSMTPTLEYTSLQGL